VSEARVFAEENTKSKFDIGRLSIEEVKNLLETKMKVARNNGLITS